MFEDRNEQMDALLTKAGSVDHAVAVAGQREFAKALEAPLRKGIMSGAIVDDIFERMDFRNIRSVEFPLDFVEPGSQSDFTAYVVPNAGYIPQNAVEGDYVTIPTYLLANSIDMNIKYARDANWPVVERAMEVMQDGVTKKISDDASHCLLSAGLDRNIIVTDAGAAAGQFTKRLVSLMKVVMRRNGGGNSTSMDRGTLTDLIVSPEAMEDIRNWNVDQIDEITRREIYTMPDNQMYRLYGVNLREWDEFGQNQEYELYYENELGGTLPAGDIELVMGLDLSRNDSFVMPLREELQVFEDPTLHRQGRVGWYCRMELGVAVLNSLRVLLGSI